MRNNQGQIVSGKPKNAYCHPGDASNTVSGGPSPQSKIVEWINDSSTKSVFMAYLSFSDSKVEKALCQKLKNGLELTLVLDSNNQGDEARMGSASALQRCGGKLQLHWRGNVSSPAPRLGFAHNKILMINPDDNKISKILFSSGNMSSGTTTHHENWHFITTSAQSHFAQIHQCLRRGMIDNGESLNSYKNYIQACRKKIAAQEESDIRVFLVPGEGNQAFSAIERALAKSQSFSLAAHRFSYARLNKQLSEALNNGTEGRLITDDDMYWAGKMNREIGRNTPSEASNINRLVEQGAVAQYMETYLDDLENPVRMQLQHNKFVIFEFQRGGSVFTGAGNLTTSAFENNFENFYMISIPEVVTQFQKQFDYMWDISTSVEKMPRQLVNP
jgi:phosphatidylserine/phosphatidylglycerophosphate/cardiolipin synthase-like enzyme